MDFEGTRLSRENLSRVLYTLSRDAPDPMASGRAGSGHRRAGALRALVEGTDLEIPFHEAISGLWSGDLECAWLAATFTGPNEGEPALIDRAYRIAVARASDPMTASPKSDAMLQSLYRVWAQAILDGRLPYGSEQRVLLQRDRDANLLAAALVWDQERAIEQVLLWMDEEKQSTDRLGFALYCRLRVSEAKALKERFAGMDSPASGACVRLIEEMLTEGSLLEDGAPRWTVPQRL